MNKRGINERQILYIFSIFIALSILITFSMLAKNIREDKLYMQRFLSIETAYLIDALSLAPDTAELIYNTSSFDFIFSLPCSVMVTPNLERVGSSKQCFAGLKEKYEILNASKFYLKKENSNIMIKNE